MPSIAQLRDRAGHFATQLGWGDAPSLPDTVYRDLVATLFTMFLPIAGMGVLYICVADLISIQRGDAVIGAMAVAALVVTLVRLGHILRFRRIGSSEMSRDELARWERGYAWGNYASALLLGALAVRVMLEPSPASHVLTISLVFTFGAGLVSRSAGRPVICIASLLMATVPTVYALAADAIRSHQGTLMFEMLGAEALIVAIVTGMSIQSAIHLYHSMVDHLAVKHELFQLARLDNLTGLPNRLLLSERFREDMTVVRAKGQDLALHFLDLDGFKAVNDRYGHPAGDVLLCQVARRLCSLVRSTDTVARLGGDEFVVVQSGIRMASEAESLARRIVKQLSEPYEIDGVAMEISVSIGIAIAPKDADDWEGLSACADAALYASKAGGKNRFAFCAVPSALAGGAQAQLPRPH